MPLSAADRVRRRFTQRTVVALVLVAGATVVGEAAIQVALRHQVAYSRQVNLAGRQRMLSQRIAKGALVARAGLDAEHRLGGLTVDAAEWQAVHRALLDGDPARGLPRLENADLRATLDSLSGPVREMGAAAAALPDAVAQGATAQADRLAETILDGEARFLPVMDRVVFGMDAEAAAGLQQVRQTTGIVLLLLLGTLSVVAVFVLRPAVRRVAEVVGELDGQRRLLRTVIDTIPDHIYVKDPTGRATLRNLASARALGFDDPEAAAGRTDAEDSPDLGAKALGDDLRVIESGEPIRNKEERDENGGWLLTTKVPLRGAAGDVVGLVGVSRDVTAAKEAEAALRVTAERLSVLVGNLQAGVLLEDEAGSVLIANARFCEKFVPATAPEALVGRGSASVLAEAAGQAEDPSAFRALTQTILLDRRAASGRALALADGRVLDWEFVPVHLDGEYGGHLWLFRDVTERHTLEDRLYHQAHHDALTGVPNRALFTSRLEVAVARREAGDAASGYALLFVDLDGFKAVNDTYGHSIGDQLLCVVASRLERVVRPGDTVARLGGDEFAVLLDGLPDGAYPEAVAERVRAVVSAPVRIDGHDLGVGASVGVVTGRHDHRDPDAVLLEADRAMYRAKAAGRRSARAA